VWVKKEYFFCVFEDFKILSHSILQFLFELPSKSNLSSILAFIVAACLDLLNWNSNFSEWSVVGVLIMS
jgi:hypothetical protein